MTGEQLRKYNKAAKDGHLIVRVFKGQPTGKPVLEQHVHPESRNWFLHVGHGGTKYVAQLGYVDRSNAWQIVAGRPVRPPALAPAAPRRAGSSG